MSSSPSQPNTVLFGYLEGVARRDADGYARGFARRVMATAERVWYQTEAFYTGYLYEIHEGGAGRSFLPDLIAALETEPEGTVLVPSGRRVFEISVRNGRPTGAMLTEERSQRVQRQLALILPAEQTGGSSYGVLLPAVAPLSRARFHIVKPTKRMKRLAPESQPLQFLSIGVLVSGLSLLTIGTGSCLWSLAHAGIDHGLDFERLPHRQWPSAILAAAGAAYVTKLEYKDGRWLVETAHETAATSAEAPKGPPAVNREGNSFGP